MGSMVLSALSPVDAEAAILAHVPGLPAISLPLAALGGAILRETLVAAREQPPFDRVTMDGIALASSAGRERRSFRIAGTQAAGSAPLRLSDPRECIEVMTGAMLPGGCDCVIPVEKISLNAGIATLLDDIEPLPYLNVHPRASDTPRGDTLLQPGIRLGPAEVAVLASNGRTQASVSRAPRIMAISTGDELVEPGEPLAQWQIHRSNVYGILAALRRRGYSQLAQDHLPDDLPVLRTRLRQHLDTHDVLILSGGVSMGRYDYVPQVLGELGVSVVFHRIAQRPGKPMWFGIGPGGKTVYALPGNPTSTLICLGRYVFGGLDAACGTHPVPPAMIPLAEDFAVKPPLAFFLPVRLINAEGRQVAMPQPTRGSGDFTSLIGTDGFVELPPGPGSVGRGTPVPFYSW